MTGTTHDIAGLVEDRPYAWVIPGDDYADMNGFIYARITEEGEFTKPLYDTAAITALQAERDAWKARAEAAEAALTRELGRWQPIETAPKDRLIDVWLKDGVRWCDCYYDRITETWRTSRPSGRLLSIQSRFVSHWMDRPPPPADLAVNTGDN